MRKYKPTIN